MRIIALVIACVALVVAFHGAVFAAVAGWHREQVRLWRTDPGRAERRKLARPWFVRYFEWLP